MDLSDVTIVTMTWVRGADEEMLVRRGLDALSAVGAPVVVADRPASPAFSRFLAGLPRVETCPVVEPGLVNQVVAAVTLAAQRDTRFILYTEPDKETFFREHLAGFVRAAPDGPDAGVVLASRSPESFATFPRIQRYTETVCNELCRDAVGIDGDYCYGPFLMHRALISVIAGINPSVGWGWRPFVFHQAHRMRRSVRHVVGDYRCPPDQMADDEAERTHRLAQLSENIRGLIA